MEETCINDVVVQSDSGCKDSEEQLTSPVSCSPEEMESCGQSDLMLVACPSASGSGRDSSGWRKSSGGNSQTRKEKLTSPEKGSTRKITKFWNFLSKKKLSPEVSKCDLKRVGDDCIDVDQSMMVSCLCSGLRRLHFQPRVVDEETSASECMTGDGDNDDTDVMTSCRATGLSSGDGSVVAGDSRTHRAPHSTQRHSLPADPSVACAAVDDVTQLLRSMTRQEDITAVSGHRATYPHLSYGVGNSSSLASSAAAAVAASDTRRGSHAWLIDSRSFESNPVHSTLKVSTTVNEDVIVVVDGQSNELKLSMGFIPQTIHTQVDYIHCLVPDLKKISDCSYYWGIMDRYEAERLLDNRPEGTFLLRDSAQEEFLFSVSFRRYSRSLHARVEQWNHKFSFDSHDPSVYASQSVCGLMEHYKDPACCMFFEPMLTLPLVRTFPFSLQHLCRAAICSMTTYDGISYLPLPKSLHQFLQYYHYKQRVRVRRFETLHT